MSSLAYAFLMLTTFVNVSVHSQGQHPFLFSKGGKKNVYKCEEVFFKASNILSLGATYRYTPKYVYCP